MDRVIQIILKCTQCEIDNIIDVSKMDYLPVGIIQCPYCLCAMSKIAYKWKEKGIMKYNKKQNLDEYIVKKVPTGI